MRGRFAPLVRSMRATGRVAAGETSADRQLVLGGVFGTVIILPGEGEFTRFRRLEEEGLVRVGRNRGMPIGGENRLAVEARAELVDDLTRNRLALGVLALAGFHLVRDQRLDLDHLAC